MASNNSINNNTANATLYLNTDTTTAGSLVMTNSSASSTGAGINAIKNRSGGVLTSGDVLSEIGFYGYDGSVNYLGARIKVTTIGTIGVSQIPCYMEFFTAPDSISASLIRLTIPSTGGIVIAAPDSGFGLTVSGGGASVTGAIIASTTLTATSGNITATNGSIEVGNTAVSTASSNVDFLKSRSGGAITTGDVLGTITFQGQDGTQYTTGSQIISTSSGTIASTRVASDLEFFTHPDSTTASQQRVVIGSTGDVTINTPDSGTALSVNINGSTGTDVNINCINSVAATTGSKIQMSKNRSGGVITSGDTLGNIAFLGFDGTQYVTAAQIIGQNTGTIATGQVASILKFATHPASTSIILTRMIIAETGAVTIAIPDSGIGLTIQGGGANITGGITSITTFGTTTGVSGIPVVVDNTGLFGTIVSSLRYKENVHDIISTNILNLRPVTFNYKSDESKSKRYGLIAEQVQKVMPDLVSYNIDGQVESVKYLDLPVLLLKEIQNLNVRIKLLEEKLGG